MVSLAPVYSRCPASYSVDKLLIDCDCIPSRESGGGATTKLVEPEIIYRGIGNGSRAPLSCAAHAR